MFPLNFCKITFFIHDAFWGLSFPPFSVNVVLKGDEVSARRRKMTLRLALLSVAALALVAGSSAVGQTPPFDPGTSSSQVPPLSSPTSSVSSNRLPLENDTPARLGGLSQPLFDLKKSDIKFSLQSLMTILRDRGHEGWVLAAYPDPKTKRPLIGAGFSLDVPVTEHLQRDTLNPHPFLEPSSAQLWQAAGLEPQRLQRILERYDRDLKRWTTKTYRREIRAKELTPEVTEEEATSLLRLSAIQAIYNAEAYCRRFDQLTGWQQLALSQLVFQMGVNLEEFSQFLAALNADSANPGLSQSSQLLESSDPEHWETVRNALINSQWARLYTARASSVIAMFDPEYSEDPSVAQNRVEASLRPIALHRRKGLSPRSVRTASYSKPGASMRHYAGPRSHRKRKLS
jgi:hypothetical protein